MRKKLGWEGTSLKGHFRASKDSTCAHSTCACAYVHVGIDHDIHWSPVYFELCMLLCYGFWQMQTNVIYPLLQNHMHHFFLSQRSSTPSHNTSLHLVMLYGVLPFPDSHSWILQCTAPGPASFTCLLLLMADQHPSVMIHHSFSSFSLTLMHAGEVYSWFSCSVEDRDS